MTTDTTLYCYIHPTRPTSLRCKRCERPICASCAVRTPTGYLCKNCVREHQKNFDTAFWYDYVLGFITTFLMSLVASGIIAAISSFLGFYMFFLAVAIAGGAGALIANIALRAVGRRRSKTLFILCAIGAGLGVLPSVLFLLFTGNFFALISLGIYAVVAIPVVYTRLAGIQL
jgi:hypothetical protein